MSSVSSSSEPAPPAHPNLPGNTSPGSSQATAQGPKPDEPRAPVAPTEEHRIQWEHAEVVNLNTVAIYFMGGVPECHGYRTEVTETDNTVTINLIKAKDTLPGVKVCLEPLIFYQMTVNTEDPVLFKTITQDPA